MNTQTLAYQYIAALDKELDDYDLANAAGQAIAKMLNLPAVANHLPERYYTCYGTKTPCGLARTIVQEMKLALQEAR